MQIAAAFLVNLGDSALNDFVNSESERNDLALDLDLALFMLTSDLARDNASCYSV